VSNVRFRPLAARPLSTLFGRSLRGLGVGTYPKLERARFYMVKLGRVGHEALEVQARVVSISKQT
jgi:hypothetical protein